MATLVAKNETRLWSLLWWGSGKSEVLLSVLCWCIWQECFFIRREDTFTFIQKFNKFFAFNAIYKDNAGVN
jgi:hypothetical protein